MDDKATPTVTLAELYENQNQHIDALVIYKNLFKKNPTDELKNKIDELKIKIFQNNTVEYSSIIDKIFSEEEKKNFHILPHEQFKTYVDSQVNLENEETYPEDLIETEEKVTISSEQATKVEEKPMAIFPEDSIKSSENGLKKELEEPAQIEDISNTPEIDDTKESEVPIQAEETIESPEIGEIKEAEESVQTEDTFNATEIDDTKDSEVPSQKEETFKSPEIDEVEKTEENIPTDNIPEIPIDEIDSMEDDLTLETNDDILLEPGKPDSLFEMDTKEEDIVSIEDIIEKNKKQEENENVIADTVDQPVEDDIEITDTVIPDTENKILNLFTKLSRIRPDIVERVLKENVGIDTPLAEIKLSDLNYVVELLTISENVEKTQEH